MGHGVRRRQSRLASKAKRLCYHKKHVEGLKVKNIVWKHLMDVRWPPDSKCADGERPRGVPGFEAWSQGFGFRVSCFGSRDSGFGSRVSGSGFRVSGFGSRFSDFGFRVSLFWFLVSGFGFWISGFGFQVWGFGFRAWVKGFGLWVSGFGFQVSGFGARGSRTPALSPTTLCSGTATWPVGHSIRQPAVELLDIYSESGLDCLMRAIFARQRIRGMCSPGRLPAVQRLWHI